MPKELIYAERPHSEPTTSDDKTPFIHAAVQISWGRDYSSVQIATGKVPSDGFDEQGAYFTTLNRHGINTLIRVLRKARDQAFGADA